MMKSASLLLLTLLGLGCASSAPPVTHYLLRGELGTGASRMQAPVSVGLGRVAVAPYLSSSQGIVIETEPGVVQAARQHLWAEPVDAGVRLFLISEIGTAFGHPLTVSSLDRASWDYRIDVIIERMHGTMDGRAVLEARYRIATANGGGSAHYFSDGRPLPQAGYPGVVEATTALLRELAQDIAKSAKETMAERP